MFLMHLALAAQEKPCAVPIVEYRHHVELTSATSGMRTEWFRFGAPEGSCTSITLPKRLEGMKLQDGDLIVLDGQMTRLSSFTTGQMLIVTRTEEVKGRRLSGEVTEPDFPVDFMVVEVSVPPKTRVSIWSPPDAKVEVRKREENRFFRASFGKTGRLVWSTGTDWWEVSKGLQADGMKHVLVDRNLRQVPSLLAEIEGLTIEKAARQIRNLLTLDPVDTGWAAARPLPEILESGHATASERGVALITLLKAAGFEAVPAVSRPEQADEAFLSVPGLAPFSRAAVRVTWLGEVTWIDPTVMIARPDHIPRTLRGGLVLAAGDVPQVLQDDLLPDGKVEIEGDVTVSYGGKVEIEAEVLADADASLALREILAPLNDSVRRQWLSDLLTAARPDATDIELKVFGVDDPRQPLGMKITMSERYASAGKGRIQAEVPALLALQLARVLPSNVLVSEVLTVIGEDIQPFTVRPAVEITQPLLLVKRTARPDGESLELRTTGYRPFRTAPAIDPTGELLFSASEVGPRVDFFYEPSGAAAKQVRGKAKDFDSKVMEALYLFAAGEDEKAVSALQAGSKGVPVEEVGRVLRTLVPLGEHRPWEAVWSITPDTEKLQLVDALEAQGDRREAWRRATQLLDVGDSMTAIRALVVVARVQGAKPSGTLDPDAHNAWREPLLLLQRATKLAQEKNLEVPEVDVGLASQLLATGKCDLAQEHAQKLADRTSPRDLAVLAGAQACRRELGATSNLVELIESSGYDPVVLRGSIQAFALAGESRAARRWALFAARLLGADRESWMRASKLSLIDGDLPTAVYAARQASDLEPRATSASIPLQLLASLLGDVESAEIASQRAGGYRVSKDKLPVSIALAEKFVEPEQRLAFLRTRDREVMEDEVLLQERLVLNERVGHRANTLRDAAWLSKRFKKPEAAVAAFRASSDTLWSTHALASLQAVLRDSDARNAHMEMALITGTSDPYADAKVLGDKGSSEFVRVAVDNPDRLMSGSDWPLALDDPTVTAPYGFEPSEMLGVLEGVVGFYNPDANVAALASNGGDILPPPVLGVFQLGPKIAEFGPIELLRLDGQDTIAYAARRTSGRITWWGLAASPQLARFAVLEAINSQGG